MEKSQKRTESWLWQQEHRAAPGHTVSSQEGGREGNGCSAFFFLFDSGLQPKVAPPTLGMGLPFTLKLLWKVPHKQAQRIVPQVTLNLVKLTREAKHCGWVPSVGSWIFFCVYSSPLCSEKPKSLAHLCHL